MHLFTGQVQGFRHLLAVLFLILVGSVQAQQEPSTVRIALFNIWGI